MASMGCSRAVAFLAWIQGAFCCTYVEVPVRAANGTTYIIARSGEMFAGLDYTVRVHPRGGKKSPHGFVSFDTSVFGLQVVTDGLNEAGFSLSMNEFGSAQFEGLLARPGHGDVEFLKVSEALLGKCASVDDAIAWLSDRHVLGMTGAAPGVHWALADATGRSVVVEYIKGQRTVFENEARVMTNDPPLDWHERNLQKFANITNDLIGLPGDSSAESRFLQAYYVRKFATQPKPPEDTKHGIVLASGLLNKVFKPLIAGSYTPFGAIKIPSEGRVLFRGYTNLQWKEVSFAEVDLTREQAWAVEDGGLGIKDVSVQHVGEIAEDSLLAFFLGASVSLITSTLFCSALFRIRSQRAKSDLLCRDASSTGVSLALA